MTRFWFKPTISALLLSAVALSGSVSARTPKGVVVPNAMAPAFDKYVGCFEQHMDMSSLQSPSGLKSAVDKALAACETRRAELVREAETAMIADPIYPDATSRSRVVAEAFDTEDAIRRAMGEGHILYEDESN